MMVERAKAMAIGSSEIATASAGYIGLQPVHALRACPDRAQSRTGGLQTQDDLRPGCLRGPVMAGEPRRGVPPYTNMATEDETPRGALACLHTGGAGTSCGRGAKGLSA